MFDNALSIVTAFSEVGGSKLESKWAIQENATSSHRCHHLQWCKFFTRVGEVLRHSEFVHICALGGELIIALYSISIYSFTKQVSPMALVRSSKEDILSSGDQGRVSCRILHLGDRENSSLGLKPWKVAPGTIFYYSAIAIVTTWESALFVAVGMEKQELVDANRIHRCSMKFYFPHRRRVSWGRRSNCLKIASTMFNINY